MKKYLFFIMACVSTLTYSQTSNNSEEEISGKVGINTLDPKRSLDINGNVKVKNLNKKEITNDNYQEILVAHEDSGNVDKIKITDLHENTTDNIRVSSVIYINDTPLDTKECSCGDITFKIDSATSTPQIKLNSEAMFEKDNKALTNFNTSYGVKTWAANSYSYYNRANTDGLQYNKTNWDKFRNLDTVGSLNSDDTIKLYNIILPKQNTFYRLTISRTKNSSTLDVFSLICENFFIESIN